MAKPPPEKGIIDIDAGTLILVISIAILLPLLLTGFFAH